MLWMALGVFVADRLVKLWALSALTDGRVIQALPGLFRLVYAENTGAAFSLFPPCLSAGVKAPCEPSTCAPRQQAAATTCTLTVWARYE